MHTLNLRGIAPNLELGEDGWWNSGELSNVSYPEEGNDLCFAAASLLPAGTPTPIVSVPDFTRRTTSMNTRDEILIAIGRIEGKLEAFASLSQRVSTLERWQAWLKGPQWPQCVRGCFADPRGGSR